MSNISFRSGAANRPAVRKLRAAMIAADAAMEMQSAAGKGSASSSCSSSDNDDDDEESEEDDSDMRYIGTLHELVFVKEPTHMLEVHSYDCRLTRDCSHS